MLLLLLLLLLLLQEPVPACGTVGGETCYYINDPCPQGMEDCSDKYECELDNNKCCCPVKPEPGAYILFKTSNQFTWTSYITVELLLWDTSIPGTPLFKGHLYFGDTSIQGTPLFRGHLYCGDTKFGPGKAATSLNLLPLLRGHLF